MFIFGWCQYEMRLFFCNVLCWFSMKIEILTERRLKTDPFRWINYSTHNFTSLSPPFQIVIYHWNNHFWHTYQFIFHLYCTFNFLQDVNIFTFETNLIEILRMDVTNLSLDVSFGETNLILKNNKIRDYIMEFPEHLDLKCWCEAHVMTILWFVYWILFKTKLVSV